MDNDEYTIDISSIGGTVTISSDMLSSSTITWDDSWVTNDGTIDLDSLNITLDNPIEFEDHMPDVAKVEDMCNDYPALRKAYENFKTIYKMVHQDWQGRQDSQNDLPF
jgi:hypothetical protein